MTEYFIDKTKKEILKMEIPDFKVNMELIREKKDELAKLKCYMPLIILWELGEDYITDTNEEDKIHMVMCMKLYKYLTEESLYEKEDLSYELIMKDFYTWVQEHQKYTDFING